MALTSDSMQTFLKEVFNFNEVTNKTKSELKCLTCRKRAYQNGSYVHCTSGQTSHRKLNLDYAIEISRVKVDFLNSIENFTVSDKAFK